MSRSGLIWKLLALLTEIHRTQLHRIRMGFCGAVVYYVEVVDGVGGGSMGDQCGTAENSHGQRAFTTISKNKVAE